MAGLGGNTLADTTFSGQSGNYITLAGGALGGATPATLDASGATFESTLASGLSTASSPTAYAIEDKIADYLDTPTLGYVSLQPTNVYVDQASENINAGAIQRGVNVAPSGGTVNVQAGVYPTTSLPTNR